MLALLLACAPAKEDSGAFSFPFGQDTPCERAPEVLLGDGDDDWTPLADGDSLAVRRHSTGAWYVPFSIEARNFAEIVSIRALVTQPDSEALLVDVSYRLQLAPDGECSGEYHGLMGYLSEVPDLEGLDGSPVRFSLEVWDDLGSEATAVVDGVAAVFGEE